MSIKSEKTEEFFASCRDGYMNVEGDSQLVVALKEHVQTYERQRPFLLQKLHREDFNLKPY